MTADYFGASKGVGEASEVINRRGQMYLDERKQGSSGFDG